MEECAYRKVTKKDKVRVYEVSITGSPTACGKKTSTSTRARTRFLNAATSNVCRN
jgi:hypothetical protein